MKNSLAVSLETHTCSLLAGLLAVVVATVPASGQQPSPSSQSHSAAQTSSASRETESEVGAATVLKATTRMVVLDVVANDKRGNPITNLKAGDFRVLEQGQKQSIRVFELKQPAAGISARPTAIKYPPNVFTNVQFAQRPAALNVILLDALNGGLQMRARLQMLRFLKTMPAGQPIAIYTLSQGLRLLQDFTSDPNLLLEAATNYREVATAYRAKDSAVPDSPTDGPRDGMLSAGAQTGNPLAAGLMESMQHFIENRDELDLDTRVRLTCEALQTLSRTLAGYPGRKNLIWISESFPLNLFPDSGHEMYRYTFRGRAGDYYDPILRRTTNSLVDAQISIYPVGAAGLVTIGLSAMDSGYDDERGGEHPRPKFGRAYTTLVGGQLDALAANRSTMDQLAARTGGKAFYNSNDLPAAIQNSITHGSSYYLLGYYPSDKNWGGGFRKVEVKVSRPEINLRYRAGYYATDKQINTDSSAQNDIADALTLSNPPSTMLFFTATLTPPSEQTANKLAVNYNINSSSISFEKGADGLHHAALACYVQAFSEEGKPIKAVKQLSVAALKPATYQRIMSEGFPCTTIIDLSPGKYQLRFAVRDERTGLIGTANGKVTIPSLAKALR